MGYGLFDYGSDTVIVKGNTFGYDGEKAVPNENGAIRLLANSLKVGKRYSQVSISNNIFYGNGGNAIQVDSMRLNPYISQNTFLETQNLAISNIREVSIPKIESITQDGDYVYISGKTDSTATIELFLTSDKAQTAEKYLEKVQTNENGEFAFKMSKSDLGNLEKYCFTATAIYPCRITSTLSDVACVTNCTEVTTDLTESIRVGESYSFAPVFENKIFTEPGTFEYQKIVERPSGCDSIVNLKLTVNDLLTAYYVKTDGTGDGSSWENAMSYDDYLSVLPIAKDGTTFYIAEGTYTKKSNNTVGFTINSNIRIIGGFSANVKKDTVSDPIKYHTKFANETIIDAYYFNFYKLTSGVTVEFHNLDFSSAMIYGSAHKVIIDSCTFENGSQDVDIKADTIEIKNSYFKKLLTSVAQMFKSGAYHVKGSSSYANVSNCTFIGNNADSQIKLIYLALTEKSYVQNCTFVDFNKKSTGYEIDLNGSDTIYFINNTLIGGNSLNGLVSNQLCNFYKVSVIGNIYGGTDDYPITNQAIYSSNNLYGFANENGKNDKQVTLDDIASILEGTYEDGIFTPTLAYNGGYTPTIKLLKDTLPDGTSIRFPLSETMVTDDQRGVVRTEKTCAGAYEIRYVENVVGYDTVCLGAVCDTLGFKIPTTDSLPGLHKYTRFVESASADTLYTLNLTISPVRCDIDVNALGYYVKTNGTGDGSSWETAMNAQDFATVLPLAKAGATFYVAQGDYNMNEYVSDDQLAINSGVKIIGGYPADAETGDKSDPVNYKTNITNSGDNNLEILISEDAAGTVEFHNLQFTQSYIHNSSSKVALYVIDSCEFKQTKEVTALIYIDNNNPGILNLRNSLFTGNADYQGVAIYCTSDLYASHDTIRNCTFSNFTSSTLPLFNLPYTHLYICNSTITGNATQGTAPNGAVFREIYNNTIVSNAYSVKDNIFMSRLNDFYGNIFTDNGSLNKTVSGSFNVADIDLSQILEGTTVDGVFTPTLAYNGGFTPTIRVVSDTLADGTSIRFALSNTKVTEDQRGEKRLASTCPGSYEMVMDENTLLDELKNIVKELTVTDQKCFGTNSGQIDLTFSNNKRKGLLKLVATDKEGVALTDTSSKVSDVLNITNLAAGDYSLSFIYTYAGVSVTEPFKDVTISGKVNTLSSLAFSSKVTGQQCYNVNNGSVVCSYSGNTSATALKFTLEGTDASVVSAKTEDDVAFSDLAPGDYTLHVAYVEEGCETDMTDTTLANVSVASLAAPFELDKDYAKTHSYGTSCYETVNGSFNVKIKNWVDDVYKAKLYQNGVLYSTTSELETDAEGNALLKSPALAGGHEVAIVEDVCGNKDSVTYDLTPLVKPTIGLADADAVVDTQLPCSYSTSGSVTLAVKGGSYANSVLYQEDGDQYTITKDTVVTFSNLGAGIKNFHYKSTIVGCPDDALFTITFTAPKALSATVTTTDANCAEVGGSAELTVDGGVTPYAYNWQDADSKTIGNTASVDGLQPEAAYACTVTDANQCELTVDQVSVEWKKSAVDLTSIKTMVAVQDQQCYGVNNGAIGVAYSGNQQKAQIRLTATDEAGNTYENVKSDTAEVFYIGGLAPGTYTLNLDNDVEGCAVSHNAVSLGEVVIAKIEKIFSLDADYLATKDPTCYNEPNGYGEVRVLNWNKAYFAVCNGETFGAASVSGDTAYVRKAKLAGGTYTLSVKDVCGHHVDTTFSLTPMVAPAIAVVDSFTKLRCSYSRDGYFKFVLTGGWPATYTTTFTGGKEMAPADTMLKDSLAKGTYFFTYKSAEAGCTDRVTRKCVVDAPKRMVNDSAVSPIVCYNQPTGEITFIPHREGLSLAYDSAQNTKNYSIDVFTGNYTSLDSIFPEVKKIEISAKNQSVDSLTVALRRGLNMDEDYPDSLTATEYPLRKFWKDTIGHVLPKAYVDFYGLAEDMYYITTTDTANCVFVDSFVVGINPTYKYLTIDKVTFDAEAAACKAENRRIEINVSGGWGSYAYSVADIDENQNEDAENGDDKSKSYGSVTAMDDSTSTTDSTYEADGKGYYRSSILNEGKYFITVTDEYGCMTYYTDTIEVKANLTVGGTVMMDRCDPSAANRIAVEVTENDGYVSKAPYEYVVRYDDGKKDAPVVEDTLTTLIDSLPNGTIGVYVTDGNGCGAYHDFELKRNDSIQILTLGKETEFTTICHGGSDGAISFTITGGNPSYDHFYIDTVEVDHDRNVVLGLEKDRLIRDDSTSLANCNLQANPDTLCLGGLSVGDHRLKVVDSEGCSTTMDFTISQPDTLLVVAQASGICPNTDGKGQISPDATTGGVKPYTYMLDYDGSNDAFSATNHVEASVGEPHVLYVKDDNGCIAHSEAVQVANTSSIDTLNPNCLVSTWHDMGDVLVLEDVTKVASGVKVDSVTYEISGLPSNLDYEFKPRELYTYGIPDSVEYVVIWNGDTVTGPSWGVPADIASGVKSQSAYQKTQDTIAAKKAIQNARLKTALDGLTAERLKNNPNSTKIDQYLADSTAAADTLEQLRQQERTNCTIDMITQYFKPTVDETAAQRMSFVRFSTMDTLLTKLDSIPFYLTMVYYANNCSVTTEAMQMYTSPDDHDPYPNLYQQDFLGIKVTPNPTTYDGTATVVLSMSNKVNYTYTVYEINGSLLSAGVTVEANDMNFVSNSDGTYTSQFELTGIKHPCFVTVRTNASAVSAVILVTGAGSANE